MKTLLLLQKINAAFPLAEGFKGAHSITIGAKHGPSILSINVWDKNECLSFYEERVGEFDELNTEEAIDNFVEECLLCVLNKNKP